MQEDFCPHIDGLEDDILARAYERNPSIDETFRNAQKKMFEAVEMLNLSLAELGEERWIRYFRMRIEIKENPLAKYSKQ